MNTILKSTLLTSLVIYNLLCLSQVQGLTGGLTSAELIKLQKITNLNTSQVKSILNFIAPLEKAFVKDAAKEYYHVMPGLIKRFNLKVGCEIGTLYGTHSNNMLQSAQLKKLFSVDAYYHVHMNWPKSYTDIIHFLVQRRLSRWQNRSTLIRAFSHVAAKRFQKHQLDFVFIDAGHDYDEVKIDLGAWYDKVRPGGILAGDDYTQDFPGVIKAVNEFFPQRGMKVNMAGARNRIWWVQKRAQ